VRVDASRGSELKTRMVRNMEVMGGMAGREGGILRQ